MCSVGCAWTLSQLHITGACSRSGATSFLVLASFKRLCALAGIRSGRPPAMITAFTSGESLFQFCKLLIPPLLSLQLAQHFDALTVQAYSTMQDSQLQLLA